jgi:hypothetical protein
MVWREVSTPVGVTAEMDLELTQKWDFLPGISLLIAEEFYCLPSNKDRGHLVVFDRVALFTL